MSPSGSRTKTPSHCHLALRRYGDYACRTRGRAGYAPPARVGPRSTDASQAADPSGPPRRRSAASHNLFNPCLSPARWSGPRRRIRRAESRISSSDRAFTSKQPSTSTNTESRCSVRDVGVVPGQQFATAHLSLIGANSENIGSPRGSRCRHLVRSLFRPKS